MPNAVIMTPRYPRRSFLTRFGSIAALLGLSAPIRLPRSRRPKDDSSRREKSWTTGSIHLPGKHRMFFRLGVAR